MDSFDLNSAIESIKFLGFKVIRPLTSRICYTDTPPPEKLPKAAILVGVPIRKIIKTHICYEKYETLKEYIDKRKNIYLSLNNIVNNI